MTVQEKALNATSSCELAMLGNIDEHGNPQIKAMIKAKNEGLKVFWFCSNTSSKRVDQLKKDGIACLYFHNDNWEGVLLNGHAEVSYDDDIR